MATTAEIQAATFDTSGAVILPDPTKGGRLEWRWPDLSPFVQGYVEAMMQAANEVVWPGIPQFRNAMGGALDLKFSDLAPETLARIMEDCERFTAPFVAKGVNPYGGGAFWTRRQVNSLAGFPPLTVYLGDDGKVRFQ